MRKFVSQFLVVALFAAVLIVVPYPADSADAQVVEPVLVNVAVDGVASQSSTGSRGVPARAIDGNTSGVWNQGSVTHTNPNDVLPWWELELSESVTIDSIVLWNRTNCCSERLVDFSVFVSDVPFADDATINELETDPAVWSYSFDGAAGETVEIPVIARGGFVRIQKPGGSALSLAEVQVFASTIATEPGDNVAVDGVASQSSTGSRGVPARAIDGNTSGVWNQGSVTHTNPSDPLPWWEVDLGTQTDIDSIVIWNRTNCCSDRLADFSVFVSATPFPANATTADLQADPNVWSYSFDGAAGDSVEVPVVASGQYVRVQKPSGTALSLAELQVFEVFNDDTVPAGNVAVDGVATQSTTRSQGGAAARAIDGNTSGVFSQNSVTHTNNGDVLPWWEVALAESTDIDNIVIWNRTDSCCASRLANFTVFVSPSPFDPDATIAELEADPAVTAFSFDGTADTTETIAVNTTGQHVRIQKPAGTPLSLAEVQVFGTPNNGGGDPLADIDFNNDPVQVNFPTVEPVVPIQVDNPPIFFETIAAEAPEPAVLPDVCSASGSSLGLSWPRPEGQGADRLIYSQITIPPNTTVNAEIVITIENGIGGTGVIGRIGITNSVQFVQSPTGTNTESGRIGFNGSDEPVTLTLTMRDTFQFRFRELTTASASATLTFVDANGNETDVCPDQELNQCLANGGNLFLETIITVLGIGYSGCVDYPSPFIGLGLNLNFVLALIADGIIELPAGVTESEVFIGLVSTFDAINQITTGCINAAGEFINSIGELANSIQDLIDNPELFFAEQFSMIREIVNQFVQDPDTVLDDVLTAVLRLDLLQERPLEWIGTIGCELAIEVLLSAAAGIGTAALANRIRAILPDFLQGRRFDRDRDVSCNSFPAGTLVLMGDGTHVAIEDISIGQQVISFSDTGEFRSQEVTAQWSHADDGLLTTVVLNDGSGVDSTAEHLYWSADEGTSDWEWVEANELDEGDLLATPGGNVEIDYVETNWAGPTTVWELSVQEDSTFTVHTGTVDVVVHNAPNTACTLSLNSSAYGRNVLDAPANSRAGSARDALTDAGTRAGITGLDVQVHHLIPRNLFTTRPVNVRGLDNIDTTLNMRLEDAIAKIERSGYLDRDVTRGTGWDQHENLLPMPSSKTDLDALLANGLDWPGGRNQIHRGDHPPNYYEGLAEILDRLPENPTPEQVIAAMDEVSDRIMAGELQPANPNLRDNP